MKSIDEKIKELQEEFDSKIGRLREELSEKDTPFKIGDKLYYIDCKGAVDFWYFQNDDIDNNAVAIGNVFKTRKEAEFMVERLKVIAEMKKFGREFVAGKANFCLNYIHTDRSLDIDWTYNVQSSNIYFESEAKAWEAIKAVGEDRIKKYYLRIED